ncbi:MAG TPA: hypothetical protein VFH18_00965 [Erysipelotrichaceae bacterium]|nr:hypothetical protein [Erysipelotrichaceae bacterium]
MGYHHIVPVEISAQTKILVSRVIIGNDVAKITSRFGITYDCVFNDNDITIGMTNPFKLKEIENAKAIIPYNKIEMIKFSIVKLPIRNILEHGHYFALDVLIQTKDSSFHCETFAYSLLDKMIEIAKHHHIHVIDPIGLESMCSGLCVEAVKEKITPIYDDLKHKYHLQDIRTLDDRSKVNL